MGLCSDALYKNLRDDLSLHLTDEEMNQKDVWPDATYEQFASHALLHSFYKKFVDSKKGDADSKALEKFKSVNNDCKNWSLQLDSSWDEVLYNELKSSVYCFWYRDGYDLITHPFDLLQKGKCGPGVSVDALGNDFYSKLFSSPLSCTSTALYEMYNRYIDNIPDWSDAELNRKEQFGDVNIAAGSRLTFVPKTNDISRMICIEPSLNMFYQLGAGAILEKRIREVFNISLETQPDFNRVLARQGSLDESLVTIDLSSASDSLSLNMLREVLPFTFRRQLEALRSPVTEIDGETIELNMISTMGNGFTFPLQTMLFSCVVSACMRARSVQMLRNRQSRQDGSLTPGNFGVFGDDIIVPREIQRDVIRLLNILGFKINEQKTFVEGPFRESCGYDSFQGRIVRGVYIKRLKTSQDRYVAINMLNDWSSKTGILLPKTIAYLLKFVERRYVPLHENSDAGVKVPICMVEKRRFDTHTASVLYQAFVTKKRCLTISLGSISTPRWHKKLMYNPSGLLLAFLNGYVRNSSIGIRLGTPIYYTKWKITPHWDNLPTGSRFKCLEATTLPIKDAIYFNMFRES